MRADGTVDKIKYLCRKRKWSLYRLSRKSGIPESTVYQLKKGRKPSLETLQHYCDCFQITLKDFFSDEPDPESVISPTELQIVKDYRQLTEEQKLRMLGYMSALGEESNTSHTR